MAFFAAVGDTLRPDKPVMQMSGRILVLLSAVLAGSNFARAEERSDRWKPLDPLPDPRGFAGMFAGVSGDALIAAGGANFPDKKPWEGGRKVWSQDVFVLTATPGAKWKLAGKLPRALGYGVSASHADGVICVGGSDARRHFADVFRLDWRNGKLTTTPLPALPRTVANACGALVGHRLYVAGGQETPDAKSALPTLFVMDLAERPPKWTELESCPGGGRILAVAATLNDEFWQIGGARLIQAPDRGPRREYLKETWKYRPNHGWERMSDLPTAVVAAPSPAPTVGNDLCVLGGDDGTQLDATPDKHSGFSRKILRYDVQRGAWREAGTMPAARVTAPCVRWRDAWVICSGEMRPGIRSPQVWEFSPHE